MKTIWDKLWWNIGIRLWRKSARQYTKEEVDRRLNWMSTDYKATKDKNLSKWEYKILKVKYSRDQLWIAEIQIGGNRWLAEFVPVISNSAFGVEDTTDIEGVVYYPHTFLEAIRDIDSKALSMDLLAEVDKTL